MSINDDECIILYTCTKSMCNILSICHNSVSSLMLMRQYNNNSVYKHVKALDLIKVVTINSLGKNQGRSCL
jgi:hypothetical protein